MNRKRLSVFVCRRQWNPLYKILAEKFKKKTKQTMTSHGSEILSKVRIFHWK